MAGNPPRTATGRPRKTNCFFCATKIDKSTPALECDNCAGWVCLTCSDVPLSLYTELVKQGEGLSLEWKCKSCKATKNDLKSIHKTLIEMKNENETRLKNVEDGLSVLKDTMKSTVQEEVDKVKDGISESVTANIASVVKDMVDSQLKEIGDRKNRANNIIVFKIDMCKDKEASVRKEYDINIVKELFSAICPDKGDLCIKTCFRLINRKKKPDEGTTSIPPLKVILESKDQRYHFLRNSKKITDLEDESLKGLIIARDLTKEQRSQNAALQKEKSDREALGEAVEIRNRKVVPARARPDSFRD